MMDADKELDLMVSIHWWVRPDLIFCPCTRQVEPVGSYVARAGQCYGCGMIVKGE